MRPCIQAGGGAKARNMPDIPSLSRLARRAPAHLKLLINFCANPKKASNEGLIPLLAQQLIRTLLVRNISAPLGYIVAPIQCPALRALHKSVRRIHPSRAFDNRSFELRPADPDPPIRPLEVLQPVTCKNRKRGWIFLGFLGQRSRHRKNFIPVGHFRRIIAPNGDQLQFFGSHHRPQPNSPGRMGNII